MNLELCFSITSSFLFLGLRKNNKWITCFQKENFRLHSENFIFYLKQIIEQKKILLSEINSIYFTSQTGNQTGIRIGIAFISTLQVLNSKIKFYYIDSLIFQSNLEDCISLITIDKQSNKFYIAINKNNKQLVNKIINIDELKILQQKFPNYLIKKDFELVNFSKSFDLLKNNFILISKIEELLESL